MLARYVSLTGLDFVERMVLGDDDMLRYTRS
jgi:hypothetical protein